MKANNTNNKQGKFLNMITEDCSASWVRFGDEKGDMEAVVTVGV